VSSYDGDATHANWMENFPWTRLSGSQMDGAKEMVDLGRLRTLPPFEVRQMLEDGSYGGAYQRAEEDMLAIWKVAVEETRSLIESW
jgi:creatinine amidohydrolase